MLFPLAHKAFPEGEFGKQENGKVVQGMICFIFVNLMFKKSMLDRLLSN